MIEQVIVDSVSGADNHVARHELDFILVRMLRLVLTHVGSILFEDLSKFDTFTNLAFEAKFLAVSFRWQYRKLIRDVERVSLFF